MDLEVKLNEKKGYFANTLIWKTNNNIIQGMNDEICSWYNGIR